MLEIDLIFFKIFFILTFFIIIFIYSAISTDLIVTLISFLLFLTLLIPFFILFEYYKYLMYINNYEEILFFKIINIYLPLIPIFIGLFLFIELVYLFLIS